MKSKLIFLALVALLVLAFTSFVYAETLNDRETVSKPANSQFFSDEDYNKMIDFMREQGYDDMADQMESIDKDTMLRMHNSMHGRNRGNMWRMHNNMHGEGNFEEGFGACH